MKRLSMIMVCLFAMMVASLSAKAQEVTITLKPGWTWIGYPSTDTVDFATALGTFTPREGDMIACEYDFSEYFDGGWFGDIQHFYPGYGYMYYSTRAMPVMVTFNTQPPTPQLTVTTAEPTEITANSAVSGGSIISNNGNYIYVFMKGICWATHPNPMVMNDSYTENGSGAESFTAEMTDLSPNMVYYVRAFAVTLDGTFYGDELNFTTLVPEGAINSLFSINANGDQVYFSQGNLQYIGSAATPYWKFAENQWDYLGDNGQGCNAQNVDRDFFGWGTSGYNHGANCYQPWSTATSGTYYHAYGQCSNNLYDQTGTADWGFNPISNGGNQYNRWRTLTKEEWIYVFNERSTTSGIRYAKVQVNNVNGIVLLPDDWSASIYNLSNVNTNDVDFSCNIINSSNWSTLEQAGVVFLPAAGYRAGTPVSHIGCYGHYWSASYYDDLNSYCVYFLDSNLNLQFASGRCNGFSVRLVQDYQP